MTGPPLRAAGLAWDVRRALPYECYPELDFEIPTGKNADTYDRYLVRVAELRQSRRILLQCCDWLAANPTGEIRGKVPRVIKPPAGDVYASVESPKGELGFYLVSNGGNKPYRLRVRPPSFINLQALAGDGARPHGLGPRRDHRHDRHRSRRGRPLNGNLREPPELTSSSRPSRRSSS